MAETVDMLVCSGLNEQYKVEKVKLGRPRDDEILVCMRATGVCHTDFACCNGTTPVPLPLVGGHEGAGIVEAVGADVKHVDVGDHVLLTFTACSNCEPCTRSLPAYCTNIWKMNFQGSRLDGSKAYTFARDGTEISSHFFGQSSFGQKAIVRASSAIPISKDLPLETLCPLGCSIQTGAGSILNVLKPQPGNVIAIFGTGAVGMTAVMAAALTPASKIIAIDLQDSKLDKARALGATVTINPEKQDVLKNLLALTGNFGIDRAIDTTGNIGVINTMIESAAPGAIVASVGAPRMGAKVEIEPASWLIRGVSYIGVHQGSSVPQQFLPYLIQIWKDGRLPLEKLIRLYHYTDIERAKSDMETGICIKAVLRWDTDG